MRERPQDNRKAAPVKGFWAECMAIATPVIEQERRAGIDLNIIEPNRSYTFAEITRLTGVSWPTLTRWRKRGLLAVYKGNPTRTTGLNFIRALQQRGRA